MKYLQGRQRADKNFTFELIIVDDGSRDETSKIALGATSKYGAEYVRLLKLVKNRGKGGAVKLGMLRSRGKYLLMVDADGATKISDLEKLETGMKELERESNRLEVVVIGSRWVSLLVYYAHYLYICMNSGIILHKILSAFFFQVSIIIT